MTRAQRAAKWGRRALLLSGVILLLAGLIWIVLPLRAGRQAVGLLGVIGFKSESPVVYAAVLMVYLGLFVCTQWFFLRPRKQWTMRQTLAGRPMKRSIYSAALIASLLSVGLAATLLEVPDWWRYVVSDVDDVEFRTWPGPRSTLQAGTIPSATAGSRVHRMRIRPARHYG